MLHTATTITEWLTNLSLYENQATLPNKSMSLATNLSWLEQVTINTGYVSFENEIK